MHKNNNKTKNWHLFIPSLTLAWSTKTPHLRILLQNWRWMWKPKEEWRKSKLKMSHSSNFQLCMLCSCALLIFIICACVYTTTTLPNDGQKYVVLVYYYYYFPERRRENEDRKSCFSNSIFYLWKYIITTNFLLSIYYLLMQHTHATYSTEQHDWIILMHTENCYVFSSLKTEK